MFSARNERLKEKTSLYFDEVAERREEIEEPIRCHEAILAELDGQPGGRLLDVGCGTGQMLARIRDVFPGIFSLYGLDISRKSLVHAKSLLGGDAALAEGDAEALPYEEGRFEAVLCMHSFHHYPHPVSALREMRRVLAPGGTLYLVENEYTPAKRIFLNITLFIRRHPNGDIRMLSGKELRNMAEKAGFEILSQNHIADHSQLLICRRPE